MISSLFKKQHQFSLSRALGVTIALAGLTTQGCIGDDESGGGGPSIGEFENQEGYSFKAYFRGANETDFRLLETPPMEAFAAELSLGTSRKAQAVDQPFRDLGMGTGQKEQPAFTYYFNESGELVGTPWSPAYFAAAACATEHGTWAGPWEYPHFGAGSLFIWTGVPREEPDYPYTCDGHLLTQENMLCTAAKLAEMAEAVEPITLTINMNPHSDVQPLHTVVVPPQSNQDRFILRDQAFVILDLLSKLAVAVPVKRVPGTNDISAQMNLRCTQAYVNAHNNPAVNTPIPVFAQVPWVDLELGTLPATPSPEQKQAFVRPRVELQAHIIRAATRLTRELVEKSLEADLAGAEKARARSMSDAWAMDPKKNLQGYNSYRHAVRVILGSWEPFNEPSPGTYLSNSPYLGSFSDPECNGFPNVRAGLDDEDLVDLIPGLDLEVSLVAPRTVDQSLAWRMFRSSGLVVPNPKAKPVAAMREALRLLLLTEAAVKADVKTGAEYATFAAGPIATGISKRVADLKEEDLRYGAARSLTIYSLLTNQETLATVAVPALPAGPTSVPWGGNGLATALAAVSGFAITGGVPEHELNRSTFTKFSAAARNCSSGVRKMVERLQRPLDDLSLIAPTERLVNEAISELNGLTGTSRPARFSSLSGVEQVEGQPAWTVEIFPTAAGPEKLLAVWNDFIFIQGGPMEAECAAGLRSTCSSDLLSSVTLPVLLNTPPPTSPLSPQGRVHLGRLANNDKPIWAIIKPHGHEPGQIIGMSRLPEPGNSPPVDFSDWELELLARVQSGRTIASPDCTAVYDAASTSHCIPDVARDAFVPVSNSLTGEGQDVDESWRHYLELAKVASAEADELGRQIIEVGTTRELRRENAQMALGQMCGGFPDEEDLIDEDRSATACLDEDDVDVVYFGAQQDAVNDLNSTVCAPTGPLVGTELCKRAAGMGTAPLSTAALGFTTADAAGGQPTASWSSGFCDEIYRDLGAALGVSDAGNVKPPYGAFITGGDLSQAKALQAVNRLRLSEVDLVGQDWVLTRGQSPMLAWVSWPEDQDGIIDATVAGQPAPGVFGEYPGCHYYSRYGDLNCSDGWDGCCSPQAKKVMTLLGTVVDMTASPIETTYWRRSVESALWTLGYASGAVPEGMFTVPVPARAFPSSYWPLQEERILDFGMGTVSNGLPRDIPLLNGTVVTRPTWPSDGGDLWVPGPTLTSSSTSGQFWQRFEGPFQLLKDTAPESEWLMTIAANSATAFRGAEGGELTVAEFKDRFFEPEPPPTCYKAGEELIPNTGSILMIKIDSCSSPDVLDSIDWPTLAELLPNTELVPDPQNYRARPFGYMCNTATGPCHFGTAPLSAEECGGELTGVCSACEVTKHPVTHDVIGACRAGDRALASLTVNMPRSVVTPLAAALMCLANESRTIEVASPPVVRSAADVDVLRTWLEGQAKLIADIQRKLFAIGIPAAAVEYHQLGLVPYGVVGSGERGNQILQIASSLEEVDSGFRAVRSGIEHLASSLGGAESQFEAVELAGDKELLGVALQKVDAGRQVAQGAISIARGLAASANFFAGVFSGGSSIINGGFDVAAGAVDTATGMEKLSLLDEVAAVAALQEVNSTAQVIVELNAAMLEGVQEIEAGISQIGQAQLAVASTLNEIKNRENDARVQQAMMEGEDFADLNGDGEPDVAFPVNAVYRRQYDVLRARYDEALASAKRYAYYARLAMEQRLGVRLTTLKEHLGPVPPPSSWVDDLCQMTGIDYDALRTTCAKEDEGCIDGGTDLDEGELIAEFASQYVGDYVDQLEEFLENYNIKYPFQDSEDLAVISVRDHVITPQVCDALPTNLLAASGDLVHVAANRARGWTHTGCSGDSCLEVEAAVDTAAPAEGLALSAPLDPPLPGGASQVTVYPRPAEFPPSPEPAFPTSVYQQVELKPGATYELSWWDSGATPVEGELPAGGQLYYAMVFNADEDPSVLDLHESHQRTSTETWSERKEVQFTAPQGGTYFVGFQFLTEGSTAIANVQLVNMADTVAGDAVYVHTDQFGNNSCAGATAESFAEHFDHKCDDRGCFYELNRDFLLKDTDILDAAFAEAGIPAGNYNYRHLGVAANAVGTGLVDCEGQNTSCFANSFVEYDLEHAAFQSHVTNYGGDQQCFSFGRGAIRHGKMLAAERVLGIPMSSTDEDLLADEDFMKPILKGRPIDGQYHLRIYDREGFNIEQLEDVQIVLKHVYWSRVERSAD